MKYNKFRHYIIVILCLSMPCTSQNALNEKEYIPILTGGKIERIEFFDSNINDSLRVVYKVVVNLEYPLKDTTKIINIQSFDLISLSVINLITKEIIINPSYDNNIGTDYQKYVWSLCYNKLKYGI
ncbi:MAG: hypothetical protein QM654_00545 [Dysgonamonadaceae bacterium]